MSTPLTGLLALATGMGLGYILERGDLCFASTLRGLFRRPRRLDLLRAYVLSLLVAVPLVQVLVRSGLVVPWVPPFVPLANVVGGMLFGVGMVVAASCVTGLFYKLGGGMLGTLVALAAWAMADVATYSGPLQPVSDAMRQSTVTAAGQPVTMSNLAGPAGGMGVAALWVLAAVWLRRSFARGREPNWDWPLLGTVVGIFGAAAWLLARAGGSNYTFGTSGVPSSLFTAAMSSSSIDELWIPLTLAGLVPGAFLAAALSGTLWVRGESLPRYVALAAGGALMGVGAAIAGGCNLAHALVGVPLLSVGSIVSTLAMIAGVGLAVGARRLLKARISLPGSSPPAGS